jgi:superfamily II DNA or RNA helicase
VGAFADLFSQLDANDRIKGKQFEHICKWFLTNDSVYKHELRRVWLWDEWTGRWGGDAGIDLVAEDRTGHLWAIQAKAYDPAYRVTKRDVNKFLAESGREVFTYRMLIATTNLIDRIGERTVQDQEKRVTFFRLNDLQAADVDWPASPTALRPTQPRKPTRPRKYQREAITKVVKGFESADRGQLIMACGTGKTLTALFVNEKLNATRTLILVPSLSLLKQTLNVWRANCNTEFASLPVCSDDTVARDDDAAVLHTSDIGVPVTTDPTEIAAFLRQRSGPRMVFATYHSSPQIAKAFTLGRVPSFDLVIADEAHRCAGPVSSDFATVLDPAEIKAKRRLFMTATPRYFTGRVLKAAQDAEYEIASMDDESKFGSVFHRLSFGEAIKRDLLTDYQVAVIGVDDATYREWAERGAFVTMDGVKVSDATTLAGQIGLAKAMRKYDLHRVISFHSRVKRASEFAASMPDVLAWMPARQRPKGELWSRYASGEMPAGDRYVLLQHLGRLEDADRGLLTNARCLAEGVDVPTLDGVAFIDPRRSEVDIVQAVGRAIRKSADKTVGTLVIPVFIDTQTDAETALKSSVFKPVWEVIQALRAHDEQLGKHLDTLRRSLGKPGGRLRLPDKIHLDLPTKVDAAFAEAFDVRLVEQTTASWEFWYGLLEQYVEENGHAGVPSRCVFRGYALANWMNWQRFLYSKGELAKDRQTSLRELPEWTWSYRADAWDRNYSLLLDYIAQHGHASVGSDERYKGVALGRWIEKQRRAYRDGKLAKHRADLLGRLEQWSWEPRSGLWEKGYAVAVKYAAQHDFSKIQASEKFDGYQLWRWVNTQRTACTRGVLSDDRVARLNCIDGWVWGSDRFDKAWEQKYNVFAKYVDENDNADVPAKYKVDGCDLGAWIVRQRLAYSQGKLEPSRVERLEKLGIAWTAPRDKWWEENYERLLNYVRETGHARVSPTYEEDDGCRLGRWAYKQRVMYANGKLDSARAERLRELPAWEW